MNNTKLTTSVKSLDIWQLLTVGCLFVYGLLSIIYIFLGELNADEGWYLYAGRLVYEGQLPYQDFAYTQTPLLPYIYGFFQIGGPSLYLGRIISTILSSIAFLLSIQVAKKLNGLPSAALTALLWVTFTYGIYYQSITKTYALLLVFFSGTFYFLLLDKNRERATVTAALFVLLASLTRLSALFFAIPILLYAFWIGTKKTKIIIIMLSVAAVAFFCMLALPNWPATYWNILLHHTNKWGDISGIEKSRRVIFARLPLLFLAFPTYATLFLIVAVFNFRVFSAFLRKNKILLLLLISLMLFAVPNLVAGKLYSEYFVPLMFSLFPILGAGIVKIWPKQTKISRIFLQVVLLSTFILGLLRGGSIYIDVSGGRLPVEEAKEIASLIEANSDTEDLILALEGLWIVVEADRHTLPGMAMAQFSYLDVESKEAARYLLINDEILLEMIHDKEPAFIVITDTDWELLKTSDNYDALKEQISANYSFIDSWDNFGQEQSVIELYSRIND